MPPASTDFQPHLGSLMASRTSNAMSGLFDVLLIEKKFGSTKPSTPTAPRGAGRICHSKSLNVCCAVAMAQMGAFRIATRLEAIRSGPPAGMSAIKGATLLLVYRSA